MKKNNLGFILAGLMFALLQMSFVFASLAMAEEISLPVEFVNEISDVRFYDSWYLDPDYTTANGRIGDVHGNTEKSLENGQVLAFRTIRKAHRDYRHPSSIYQQFPLPPPSIEPYLSGGADYVDLNGDGQKDLLRSYSFNSQDGANINRAIVASHFMKKHAPTIAGFNLSANAERAARKLLHFVAIQNWNAWFIRSNEWVNQLIDLRSRGIVACSSMYPGGATDLMYFDHQTKTYGETTLSSCIQEDNGWVAPKISEREYLANQERRIVNLEKRSLYYKDNYWEFANNYWMKPSRNVHYAGGGDDWLSIPRVNTVEEDKAEFANLQSEWDAIKADSEGGLQVWVINWGRRQDATNNFWLKPLVLTGSYAANSVAVNFHAQRSEGNLSISVLIRDMGQEGNRLTFKTFDFPFPQHENLLAWADAQFQTVILESKDSKQFILAIPNQKQRLMTIREIKVISRKGHILELEAIARSPATASVRMTYTLNLAKFKKDRPIVWKTLEVLPAGELGK